MTHEEEKEATKATAQKRSMEEMASLINDARIGYSETEIYGYEPTLILKWQGGDFFELKINLNAEQVKKVLAVVYEGEKK